MRDPDWFLKWFFYVMMVVFGLIIWLASATYAKTTTWDEWLKEDIFGSSFQY